MPAPPPPGSTPGSEAITASGAPGGARDVATLSVQEPARPQRRRGGSPDGALPPLLVWLPVTLSTALLVLFAVVVNRQQAQAERIGELLSRVQALEHSRALERTAVLEQQLRTMLSRLQSLEKGEQQRLELARQLQTVQQELQLLRSTVGRAAAPPSESGLFPDPAPRIPRQAPPPQEVTP